MTAQVLSRPYDHPLYTSQDTHLIASTTGASAISKYVSFTGRQLKSVTLLPTTAGTSNDIVQFIAVTSLPVTLNLASGATTSYTGSSTLTILALGTFGSGSVTPQSFTLAGGTYNIQVVNVSGTTTSTSTATNVVLPTGPQGGLSIGALDQYQFKKGTDATVVYVGEVEYAYTPGTNFTG